MSAEEQKRHDNEQEEKPVPEIIPDRLEIDASSIKRQLGIWKRVLGYNDND